RSQPRHMITYPKFEPTLPRTHWTVPAVLEHQAISRGDAPFLVWGETGRTISFAEANAIANRLARGFANRGVGHGDHVVIFLPNCLEHVLCWLALAKLGVLSIAVGEASKGDFLEHQIALAQPAMVITSATLVERLVELEKRMPSVTQ